MGSFHTKLYGLDFFMKPYPGLSFPKLPSFITSKAHFSRIRLQKRRQLLEKKQRLGDEEQVEKEELKSEQEALLQRGTSIICWRLYDLMTFALLPHTKR
jgi:hypothetical protein